MIGRLLPRTIDGSYGGSKVALWLLGLVAALKLAMGLNSILNGRSVLSTADGIPLATYPADAAQTVVALFAIWAWSLLLFALLSVLVLVRYRSLTPFMFALLLVEHAGRKVILQFIPMVRSDNAPASWINAALLALMALGFVLSLWRRGESHESLD
jgi:hypothetical protein